MSAGEDSGARRTEVPPLASDRPYVDGAATPPDELRAEAEEQAALDLRQIEDDRAALAATVAELSDRLDVRARARDLRGAMHVAALRPAVLGGFAAALLGVLLLLRRRHRPA
jgi:hypothetical protein